MASAAGRGSGGLCRWGSRAGAGEGATGAPGSGIGNGAGLRRDPAAPFVGCLAGSAGKSAGGAPAPQAALVAASGPLSADCQRSGARLRSGEHHRGAGQTRGLSAAGTSGQRDASGLPAPSRCRRHPATPPGGRGRSGVGAGGALLPARLAHRQPAAVAAVRAGRGVCPGLQHTAWFGSAGESVALVTG